ncbi:class I adenylate-forming enzyme family protein [Novosphingobium pentaromativorans]|uniref:AMP-dependent synthetase and ligase n=1 Tax=Novosphingobium pentaromativorans US6-1 TaxID=1088721 RepID=G6ECI7_9SPHN|nr:class I adenylate-forming enzyme family protein [Novosphingobium pentaromativorans]EHJ60898.1 hypothetical protein NSU_2058 [Novosphingobium pentaromativorans US6-1]
MADETAKEPRASGPDALATYRAIAAELTAPGAPFAIVQPGLAATRRMMGTHSSFYDIIEQSCAQNADFTLLDFEGDRRSYGKVDDDSRRIAAALRDVFGIAKGDVVGLVMRNCPHWFSTFFAIQRIGAVAALLNSRNKGPDIAAAAQDVGARLIVADERCAGRLEGKTGTPVIGPDVLDTYRAGYAPDPADTRAAEDEPAMVLFTSGTTGRAKGATISHRNLCTCARQLAYMNELGLTIAARNRGIPLDVIKQHTPRHAPLLIVPMFHISGITQMITTLQDGGLLAGMRRWDPANAMDLIERAKVTQVSGPSLVMADLLALPRAKERMASVSSLVVSGQASPIALTERMRRDFPRASQAAGWGMTELTGTAASCSGAVFAEHPGKVGVPLPLAEIAIRAPDGSDRPVGEVGEIAVRGPTVMTGYWGLPEANEASFDGEWFLTGDLGMFDGSGLLSIVDRAKDMVISAGENIYCAEVERVLAMIEDHQEVALFGVADERLGERAIAAMVFAPDCPEGPGLDAIRAHASAHLADYKVPTEIVFDLGPLPRNSTGKVDKAALRKRYEARARTPAA